jgi:hypothetical protein
MLCLDSKAVDFGIGDLRQTHVSKPVEEIPTSLSQPQITSVQAEPVVGETPISKPGETPADKQGKVNMEKTPAVSVGKGVPSHV